MRPFCLVSGTATSNKLGPFTWNSTLIELLDQGAHQIKNKQCCSSLYINYLLIMKIIIVTHGQTDRLLDFIICVGV